MEYVQLTLDEYIGHIEGVKKGMFSAVQTFVEIGYHLYMVKESEGYKLGGYSSFAECTKAEFKMDYSRATRFINVYKTFSKPGERPEIQDKYKEFDFEQLSEMLQLTEEDQDLIQPETNRTDIRELKKFNKDNENNPEGLLNWKDGQQDKTAETIREFFRANREALNDLYSSEAYQTGNVRRMAELVNPSGNRSFRKGTVFMMMYGYDKGIMVKQIPQGTRNMSWEEFFSVTQEIFAEAAAGSRTYENYFEEGQKTTPEPETPPALENAKEEPEFAPAQPEPKKEEKGQKIAPKQEEIKPELPEDHAPDKAEPEEKPETTEEPTETIPEEQIPGQDNIMNHPEYIPKIAPAQETPEESKEEPQAEPSEDGEILDKAITRKEYIDTLTAYGTAEYLAAAMKGFRSVTYGRLQELSFWDEWLNGKVDHSGRAWVE